MTRAEKLIEDRRLKDEAPIDILANAMGDISDTVGRLANVKSSLPPARHAKIDKMIRALSGYQHDLRGMMSDLK